MVDPNATKGGFKMSKIGFPLAQDTTPDIKPDTTPEDAEIAGQSALMKISALLGQGEKL